MSRYSLILVFLLALVATSRQGCCTDSCFSIVNGAQAKGENLVKVALQTDTTKFNPNGICGSTFASKGSCCDLKSVGTYADKLLARLKDVFKGVETTLAQAPAVLKALPALIEILKSKDPTGANPDNLFLTSIGGVDGYLKANAILQALSTRSAAILSQLSTAVASNSKCYTTLFQSRLNSLCLVCSGDADKTFNQATQKFKVKQSFCQTLVTDCSGVLDLFVKVSHAMEVTRVIRNALSSTNVQPIDPDFTEARVSIYEECALNPTACNSDLTKLTKFCKEVSLIKDPKVVKLTEGKTSDASTLSTDAATNFKTAVTQEGAKLTAAIQQKSTLAQSFDPTVSTSVQSMLTGADTTATASKTENDKLKTAQTALDSATANDLVTKATARRTQINALVTARKTSYDSIIQVLTKYVTSLQADLPTSSNFETARASLKDATKLLADVKSASTLTTDFEKIKDAYFTVEIAALAVSPPALPAPNQSVPFETQLNSWNQIDADIQTRFPAIKTAAQLYADQKSVDIKASIASTTVSKQISAAKVEVATFKTTLDTVNTQLASTKTDYTTASTLVQSLTDLKTKLTTPPALNTVSDAVTSTTNAGTSLATSKAKLASLTSAIAGPAAGTPPSSTTSANPVKDLASAESTRIASELTTVTQIVTDCTKPFADTLASSLETSIATTKATITTLTQDITTTMSQISTNEASLKTTQANVQPLLTSTITAKAAWESATIQVNNVKLAIIQIEGDLATATNDIRAQISTVTAKIAYLNGVSQTKCAQTTSASTYPQAYCAELRTDISNTQSTLTTLNQNLGSTSEPFLTKLAAQKTELARVLGIWTTANDSLTKATTDVKTQNTALDTTQTTIATLKATLQTKQTDLATAQAKLANDQSVLDSYKAKAVTSAATAFSSKCETAQSTSTILNTLKTLYTDIQAAAIVYQSGSNNIDFPATYGRYSTRISDAVTACTAAETKVSTAKATLSTSQSTVSTGLVEIGNTVTASLATQNAKVTSLGTTKTALETQAATIQSSITSTTTAASVPPKRLLQTVNDDSDTEIDDSQGSDPNTDYKAGVNVDGSLDSKTTYADTAVPTSTSTGDQATSGKSSLIWKTLCLATLATFYLSAF